MQGENKSEEERRIKKIIETSLIPGRLGQSRSFKDLRFSHAARVVSSALARFPSLVERACAGGIQLDALAKARLLNAPRRPASIYYLMNGLDIFFFCIRAIGSGEKDGARPIDTDPGRSRIFTVWGDLLFSFFRSLSAILVTLGANSFAFSRSRPRGVCDGFAWRVRR